MGIDEDIQYWLRLAESDMVSAEGLHRIGQQAHALFFLQQAVEKTLKGLITKTTAQAPPRLHNLVKLSQCCGLDLSTEWHWLLEELNRFYIESRYPGELEPAPGNAATNSVERFLTMTREFLIWLRLQL